MEPESWLNLRNLTKGTSVKGILPDGLVTVVDVKWIGTVAVELTYKDSAGRLGNELLYRDREPTLEVVTAGRPWSFDGDGAMFRLVSEAHRIGLAYLFDPLLAVHTSLVEPLPHQITAVYEEMLPRQPLRFLLADDPGAGKTIMCGLLTKELSVRGDLQRCMIVCPGNLAEQWQDEMDRRFHLPFEIMTNDKLESARTGNWLQENNLVICRLDKLSRNEDLQEKLKQTDWDLIVCDEAHKMSASFFGGEVKATKRYRLGQLLAGVTRNFLLMTATPHNGKEEDFQLFMALLDGDRFEGKFRDGVHYRRCLGHDAAAGEGEASQVRRHAPVPRTDRLHGQLRPLGRRGRPLQASHRLRPRGVQPGRGPGERGPQGHGRLRADDPAAAAGLVAGGHLPIASSSPGTARKAAPRGATSQAWCRGTACTAMPACPSIRLDDLEELDDAPDAEIEEAEEKVVDQASAARTIAELQVEIGMLEHAWRNWPTRSAVPAPTESGTNSPSSCRTTPRCSMPTAIAASSSSSREHRDTLNYLEERIGSLLGRPEALVTIHGSMGREERRKAQDAFTQDKEVEILVATDAASEGINLQRGHLMVNYDLPWNPNRLEQRFGRIHRIGQTEVCHLWNLVAKETREGRGVPAASGKAGRRTQGVGRPGFRHPGPAHLR